MVTPSSSPVLVIDGGRFTDFAGFAETFSAHLTDYSWRGSLDAFNDILRGGFGTPEGGFIVRWERSELSREALGYGETVAWFETVLARCDPSNRERIAKRLSAARRGEGPTLFDEIVEIMRLHGPGGPEAEHGIRLELR